ncbi:hypothetical protein IKE_05840 [Bacillus cereus VD196]|uniref:Uncharacterized protein n=1 Tax=Bacillus cereus VD196 TaxID=1053243 RepID=A0A9W5PYH9_BACCE|nr:hypothetical protein [Bacillus cereus]EJR93444.1 hypothetical protein IKG_05462 [Bacillus cereus VD200]EOO61618.1 hypothetical protein IKE_05840 [Bacillus cereus VD196]
MKKVKEYDLAYICYYSERIALSAIGVGFEPRFSIAFLADLFLRLKNDNKFDYYKICI